MQKEVNGVPATPMGQVSPNMNTVRPATMNPMTRNNTPNFNLNTDWKSLDITELIKALCKSQMEMSSVVQSKVNPFYKSNYADINDLLKSVLPVITKHGLAVTQGNRFCNITDINFQYNNAKKSNYISRDVINLLYYLFLKFSYDF